MRKWIALLTAITVLFMTHAELRKQTGLSAGSMTKLRKAEPVTMEVLWKICVLLKCNIGDIVEFEIAAE